METHTNRTGCDRGVSLLETLLALFLLTGASLLLVVLFHSGLQRSRLAHVEAQARIIAQDALAEVRAKTMTGSFRIPQDLNSVETSYPHPDLPSMRVDIRAETQVLASPSTGEEAPYAEKRLLSHSAAKVEVKVSWDSGFFRLVSLVGESPRVLENVVVSGKGPISAGQGASFTVEAFDEAGQKIEDAFFVWWVDPLTANGTVVPSRDSLSHLLG